MTLGRREVLGINKRRFLTVPIATFGEVRLRSLTGVELRELKAKLQSEGGEINRNHFKHLQELLLCATLVDENGDLLFAVEDAFGGVFNDVDGLFVNTAFKAAQRWTGFLDDEGFDDIETAIKNSASDRSND